MSEEIGTGLAIAEKLSGLIVLLIGAVTLYFTAIGLPSGYIESFSGVFLAAGFALVAVGVALLLARAE